MPTKYACHEKQHSSLITIDCSITDPSLRFAGKTCTEQTMD